MFGPFGLSLAPQIKSSRSLSRLFRPLAITYAKIAGHRKYGLKYDDLLPEERPDVEKALSRVPQEEMYNRVFRLRRAVQQDILHKPLPRDQWLKPEEDTRYLKPILEEVMKEDNERAEWDTIAVEVQRK